MVTTLFLFAACFAVASGAGSVCSDGNIVHMPGSLEPYHWPANWNENGTAPKLKDYQSCSWTVTIPQGYYAKFIIDGSMPDPSNFQTIDAAGNLITTNLETRKPYYFPPAKFTFIVNNGGTGATLGFKIFWSAFPKVGETIYGIGDLPEIDNATERIYKTSYSSNDQRMSILAFPGNISNPYSLRSAMVFQGFDLQGSYVSNLFLAYQSGKQMISSASNFFVINVEASPGSGDLIMAQDSAYTEDINQYVELNCGSKSTCSASVDGGSGKSALVSIHHTKETLTNIQMDDTATLTVYYGSPNVSGFYKTYKASEIKAALPVQFAGYVTQYVISSGGASFVFKMN